MKRKSIWPWFVLGILVIVLCYGCMSATKSTNTIFGLQPPVDVKNNITGEGSEDNPKGDGLPDQEWLAWKAGVEEKITAMSGGIFTGWTKALSELAGLAGLGLAAYTKWKGDKDHQENSKNISENRQEINATDKNVEIVAEHAKVPEEKLI